MPIFEYRCENCNTKFEVLHKSINHLDEVICPNCNSTKSKKLLSTFSASVNGSSSSFDNYSAGSCESGTCGCGGGACGLN